MKQYLPEFEGEWVVVVKNTLASEEDTDESTDEEAVT